MQISDRLSFHIVNDKVTAVVDNQMYSCDQTHKNYDKIIAAIKAGDADELPSLFSMARAVSDYVSPSGRLKVQDNRVFYREGSGDRAQWFPIHFEMVDHLLELMEFGAPIDAFVNFVERVMKNPSSECIEELFPFMYRGQDIQKYLPILPDGRFIAYKRVRPDWFDFHSGTVRYVSLQEKYPDWEQRGMSWLLSQPGHMIGSPRWCVDSNINRECSTGYHVGRYEYINNFHEDVVDSHILKMACDPSQVVAAKRDGSMKKVRMHVVECREEIEFETLQLICGERPPTPKLPPIPTAVGDAFPDEWRGESSSSDVEVELS